MQTVYSKKKESTQRITDGFVASVFDKSSQGDSLQRKANMANNAAQRAETPRPNNTGMPDNLKVGIESLSGFSMDDVRVHYNSSKPATVQALAYTQGTDIHVAPGQEKHLPHEAWHVAQQMAGRVSPTININGMPVNDNAALEHEADVMGEKAVLLKKKEKKVVQKKTNNSTIQLISIFSGAEPAVECNIYRNLLENLNIHAEEDVRIGGKIKKGKHWLNYLRLEMPYLYGLDEHLLENVSIERCRSVEDVIAEINKYVAENSETILGRYSDWTYSRFFKIAENIDSYFTRKENACKPEEKTNEKYHEIIMDYLDEYEIDKMVKIAETYFWDCFVDESNSVEKIKKKIKNIRESKEKNFEEIEKNKNCVKGIVNSLNWIFLQKKIDAKNVDGKTPLRYPLYRQQYSSIDRGSGIETVEWADGCVGEEKTWESQGKALSELNDCERVHQDDSSEKVERAANNRSEIPVISWNAAKVIIPPVLMRLIRDIYASWLTGSIFDERTLSERKGSTKTCDTAGALRSWHMNQDGTLPKVSSLESMPKRTKGFHEYYKKTSPLPFNAEKKTENPIGYAEYTGTGIGVDSHNCKIVLDYVNGFVYLTLTHYQFWGVEDGEYKVYDKTGSDVSDEKERNNPWFKIDMNN